MALYFATSTFQAADIVILGIPYDRTSSFIPGSRFGPALARIAADNVESFSPYQQLDLTALNIHDAGDLTLPDLRWPQVAFRITEQADALLFAGKLPIVLGGEHSITGPLVAACRGSHPDLAVVQFDAHADLRPEFLGEEHSHATAMFRAGAVVGPDSVFQYGIRSGTRDEFAQARHLHPFSVQEPLRRTIEALKTRPLYLTIDVDVLDPGELPAVSTPEPGGISYQELVMALLELRACRIVGIDLVEYNPLASRDPASAALVASLLREVILLAGQRSGRRNGKASPPSGSQTKEENT